MDTMEKLDHTGTIVQKLSDIFEGHMVANDIESAIDSIDTCGATLMGLKGAIEKTVPHVRFSREFTRRLESIIDDLNIQKQRLSQLDGLSQRALDGDLDEIPEEACPTCLCLPGDGYTDGCEDLDGCGYFAAIRRDSAGIVQSNMAQVIDLFAKQ